MQTKHQNLQNSSRNQYFQLNTLDFIEKEKQDTVRALLQMDCDEKNSYGLRYKYSFLENLETELKNWNRALNAKNEDEDDYSET